MRTYVILHNVRSVANVASIFRTADGAGISKIYLTGITPTPVDRFGRLHPRMKKISLGASDYIEWERVPIIEDLLERLEKENISLVSVEQHANSIDFSEFTQTKDTAFMFGGEVDGISNVLCERSEVVLEIPMRGQKESLNVAVTAGIVLYSATRK